LATIIDATVGGANSNSYVTTDEATAYFAQRLRSSAWTAASTEDKEKALVMACQHIEAARPMIDRGSVGTYGPYVSTQALSFPRRADWVSGTGFVIPPPVKRGQFEEALALLARGAESDRRRALQADGVSSFSVDGLSESYGTGAGARHPIESPEARALIAPYLRKGGVIATSDIAQGEFSPGSDM
jgi:hypothetical protein